MNNDLKNILLNLNQDIEQEKLLEYLNRKLSEEEQHLLETQMNNDAFMSDAMDGLEEMKSTDNVSLAVTQLNAGLKKQLESNKKRRNKGSVMKDSWIYYTVILILLLAVISYIVIRKFSSV
jgi:hypothetical protein